MKIKPILFSAPMVRAIVDGKKSMTRRAVKPTIVNRFIVDNTGNLLGSTDWESDAYPTIDDAPYHPGDILWVRETWTLMTPTMNEGPDFYLYKADVPPGAEKSNWFNSWRPSIFMPREAARIWLRVTDVRCERVQEITEEDATREGCFSDTPFSGQYQWSARDNFVELWDSLNAKRGYPWGSNPWVWAISFERCDKPGEVSP